MQCVLGIDTSNYTTSLCAVSASDGQLIAETRKLLPVAEGQRGLRQSDALFFHVQRLPGLMSELMTDIRRMQDTGVTWAGVGVSVRPRPHSSSYMPVFLAGYSFAHTFASAMGLPVVPSSHQEGHVAAANYFLEFPEDLPFLAVHLSGGTSDVLVASRTRFGYAVEMVGEGADLHAGQFVDRVGVALGLPFPAGPSLEQLAANQEEEDFRLSATVQGASLSFSGPCSAALRAIDEGVGPGVVAAAVQRCIANSVAKAVNAAYARYPDVRHCVIAGGVASNQFIRNRVVHRLRIVGPDLQVHFAPPRFSSDNGLGVAVIAQTYLSPS